MTINLLIDNDVLIKCASYRVLNEIQAPSSPADSFPVGQVGILGAAKFVVRNHLSRRDQIRDRTSALQSFDTYLQTAVILEPTDEELALASEIEEAATLHGIDLDGGESQLCAIAIGRQSPVVLTGDKRAIKGAEILKDVILALSALQGRLICLEQAIRGIVSRLGFQATRSRICAEPDIDKTLSICFQCQRERIALKECHEALLSYIGDLRAGASTLLYESNSM